MIVRFLQKDIVVDVSGEEKKKLTISQLLELVDEILIHEGGDITVKFKFNDAYKEVTEYIEMNKEIIKTA